jgi:hypothetical protein
MGLTIAERLVEKHSGLMLLLLDGRLLPLEHSRAMFSTDR